MCVGLDLGINNVGWCALRRSDNGVEILGMGTFVFDSPLEDENKPSEGLASRRRGMFRRARRTARRRHQRKMRLYGTLAEYGFLPPKLRDRVTLFCRNLDPDSNRRIDPYTLRSQALVRALTPYELGRVLCHLNQRRGFISPRDLMAQGAFKTREELDAQADEEMRGMKEEIKRTREAMAGFPTIGAFLAARQARREPVRKKKLRGASVSQQKAIDEQRYVRADRHMIQQEFEAIIAAQKHHHPILTDSLVDKIRRQIFDQRILATDHRVRGRCIFFPDEWRIPRASMTAQKFVIAQEVAHLEISDDLHQPYRKLRPEERKVLVDRLLLGQDLTWTEAKSLLGHGVLARFSLEPEPGKKRGKAAGTKDALRGSVTAKKMYEILGPKWDALGDAARRELVGEIVSIRDWLRDMKDGAPPAAIRRRILFLRKAYGPAQVRFTEQEANDLATVDLPDGYLNVSLRAIKKILPGLLEDCVYSEACARANLNHTSPDTPAVSGPILRYPTEQEIGHALVRTSVRSAIRVLRSIVGEWGLPDSICIELPRDLAVGAQQREEISKRQDENEKERMSIAKELLANGYPASPTNIKKVRLWRELGGLGLPYEPDRVVSDLRDLIEGDYEIDHIVPRSHSFDNGMANLTLCTREFNTQVKGNRTPYEALATRDPEAWNRIVAHVRGLKAMPVNKRNRILAKERPEDFTGRHLAATGYISRQVLAIAQRITRRPEDVVVTPGRATSDLRRFWELGHLVPLHPEEEAAIREEREREEQVEKGLLKPEDLPAKRSSGKQRSNYKHHALDALVVALTDRASLQALTRYYQLEETGSPLLAEKAGRKLERAKTLPDPDLQRKATEALERASVVRRPRRRPQGELHKQMPEAGVPVGMAPGRPWSSAVRGKHLVKFDGDGRPAQAYPLGNNHHVVIWESLTPNKKGETERWAEVVPMIEAVRRRNRGEPVIRKHSPDSNARFVMALCKGDTVEMEDGTLAYVASFSPKEQEGGIDLFLWHLFVARLPKNKAVGEPYLVRRMQSTALLKFLAARVVLNPVGEVVYREGGPG